MERTGVKSLGKQPAWGEPLKTLPVTRGQLSGKQDGIWMHMQEGSQSSPAVHENVTLPSMTTWKQASKKALRAPPKPNETWQSPFCACVAEKSQGN